MVNNVACQVQLFYTFMVGVFRTDLAKLHHGIAVNREGVLEAIEIPVLKESHIKAHMRRCKPFITTNDRKKGIEVPDIVHDAIRFLVIEMEC